MDNQKNIKQLEWFVPHPKKTDVYKVVLRSDIQMPHTVGNAGIEISEATSFFGNKICYKSTLWCFNRGTPIISYDEAFTLDEAKEKTEKWWNNFICGFLNN